VRALRAYDDALVTLATRKVIPTKPPPGPHRPGRGNLRSAEAAFGGYDARVPQYGSQLSTMPRVLRLYCNKTTRIRTMPCTERNFPFRA